ncbi:MAG: DNA-3-methyladenine glycosylase [Elainellaceae cyanobacterium]
MTLIEPNDGLAIAPDWLARPSPEVAPDLVGCTLVRRFGNRLVRGLIVETEAYAPGDPACHAYRRRTPRNAVMFGPAGMTYVYLIYGIYHCLNVVTDQDGTPSAVLIRALHLPQIPDGLALDKLKPTKKKPNPNRIAAGPGKLCQALEIDLSLTGRPLRPEQPLWLEHRSTEVQRQIQQRQIPLIQTTRIGLSQGTEIPWRWYIQGSPAVSKP